MDNNRSGIPTGDPRAETAAPSWTPGPWKPMIGDFGYLEGHGHYIGVDTPHGFIALVLQRKQSWNEGPSERPIEANARLIAAAPELYEALKLAREYVVRIDGTMAFTAPENRPTAKDIAIIDAALAKATRT
jgi:hypothetical protein